MQTLSSAPRRHHLRVNLPEVVRGSWRSPRLLATLALAALIAPSLSAQTITDTFTDPTSWGAPLAHGDGGISLGGERMNYTCTSANASGAAIARNTPILPTSGDWTIKVDVHIDPFTITSSGQYADVFLGFGKTDDWLNTHVIFEFNRGSRLGNYYDIGDDVRINGVDKPGLFSVSDLTSPDAALRLDYSARNHTVTFNFDADGSAGGYNWVAQGTANLVSGTYGLNLSPTDTFTMILLGSSENQVVAAGQAYWSNLEITFGQAPVAYTYTTNNGNITITGYTGSEVDVIIPASIDGLPVAGIGDSAFNGKSNLRSITIPHSVTSIGRRAFYGCTSLTNISIPESVTNIGDGAFMGCTSLTNVTIPNSVTNIGHYAFYGCTGLTNVTIPDGVTRIGDDAFSFCRSLTSVTIPNSVTNIGDSAFDGCSGLTSITIPDSVTSIGDSAFYRCTSLTAITVDGANSTYSSVDGVLFDASRTTLIQFPGRKTGNYTIPSSVTNIGNIAFSRCTGLTNVTIPDSVTSIGWGAFSDCTSLTNVTIPDSVTSIVGYAFYRCTSLTNITIPSSVTSIGDSAFNGCSGLNGVYFQGNAPSLGSDVFFETKATIYIYYLPGTTGWSSTFGRCPTVLWKPMAQASDTRFGVQTNRFGFNLNWASGRVVVVEASTNLSNPTWSPVSTNTLTDGSSYFSDPQWTNSPARFYRLRSP